MRLPPTPEEMVQELCRYLHARQVELRLWRSAQRHAPLLLAHLRRQYRWTQGELAERIGLDVATVGKIEAGHEVLSREAAQRLAQVLAAAGLIWGYDTGR